MTGIVALGRKTAGLKQGFPENRPKLTFGHPQSRDENRCAALKRGGGQNARATGGPGILPVTKWTRRIFLRPPQSGLHSAPASPTLRAAETSTKLNTDQTRKRRKLALIAVGMALLILVGWFVATWLPQAGAHGSGPTATATAAMESGDSPEASALAKSRVRKAEQNDEQIRIRVESMLKIKSNEIAIVTVPTAALDQCFRQPSFPVPSLRGLVSKDVLKACLEGVLRDGGPVKVMVGDDNTTEYTANGFQVKVKVTEKTDGLSKVQVETTGNGSKLQTEMYVHSGDSLVLGFPAPAEVGIVILIGNDPGPATELTQP